MTAYYNDVDPRACATLKELINAGEIAPGVVDNRSIKDVTLGDLRGFTQVHMFAGIGVWSHAARRAGWPDWRPLGTGSCPCQPFSNAGDQNGFADPRHLWPEWLRLIRDARSAGEPWAGRLFGEQVASANDWLALVQSDLEADGFAFGAADLAAAGFTGAHIRQRFMWVADANDSEWWADHAPRHLGDGPQAGRIESASYLAECRAAGRLAHGDDLRGHGSGTRAGEDGRAESADCSDLGGLGYGYGYGEGFSFRSRPVDERGAIRVQGATLGATSPLRGCDWLLCHDARIRPVEPGTFPLATEAPARVGRLHGYGNAIDAETLTQFISSYIAAVEDRP